MRTCECQKAVTTNYFKDSLGAVSCRLRSKQITVVRCRLIDRKTCSFSVPVPVVLVRGGRDKAVSRRDGASAGNCAVLCRDEN